MYDELSSDLYQMLILQWDTYVFELYKLINKSHYTYKSQLEIQPLRISMFSNNVYFERNK